MAGQLWLTFDTGIDINEHHLFTEIAPNIVRYLPANYHPVKEGINERKRNTRNTSDRSTSAVNCHTLTSICDRTERQI